MSFYFVYMDESYDQDPSGFFVVGSVIVPSEKWSDALDELRYLRQSLKDQYSIPVRAELKASEGFLKGKGPFYGKKSLSNRKDRMQLFSQILGNINGWGSRLAMSVFATAISKSRKDYREEAWLYALQRIDNFCSKQGGLSIIFHDEGEGNIVKRLLRKSRRYNPIPKAFGQGHILSPMGSIIEDAHSKNSKDSYFIQVADWISFAALRSHYVNPKGPLSSQLWDHMPNLHLLAVNSLKKGPPAIVKY